MSVLTRLPAARLQGAAMLLGLALAIAMSGCTTAPAHGPAPRSISAARVPEQLKPDLFPDGAKPAPEPVVRYGRYTLVSTSPSADQRDLMSQIVDVTIPDSLNPNVWDAMSYVLKRSGYALCSGNGDINILYTRPLPASEYHLGPMTLRNTLQILAGPAWQVEVDEITRGICFIQRPGYQRLPLSSVAQSSTPPYSGSSVRTFPAPVLGPVIQGGRP